MVRRFSLFKIRDPVAFKKRDLKDGKKIGAGAFAQLVIFTEVNAGHFNNDLFHVFQVNGPDLKLFYENSRIDYGKYKHFTIN